ncbi:MAG: glycosyltransferase [Verrucomicrobiota bacterium]
MPEPGPTRTVALVSPLWYGHHPVYFGHFTRSFLRAGARVIGLCPDPDTGQREIQAALDGVVPDWEDRVILHRLRTGGRSWFGGRFEGDPYHTFQRWRYAAQALDDAEAASGWPIDLVHFPYIDAYLRFLPFSPVPEITIGRPWSGLYLRNHHHRSADRKGCGPLRMLAKGDALMRSSLCREVGVLDERFVDSMSDYLVKPVVHYPDITSTQLPKREPELTRKVRENAAGRKIIGLIGLETRKGMLNMLRVALKAHEAGLPWFFVFAGVFDRDAYSREDLAFIETVFARIKSCELDNIHFDPEAGRIPTEADFNSLFSSFDIAWAAFEGFQGSSGTLSKAGAFQIPALATAGECIGHRLEHFGIGLTIPEGDTDKAFDAILRLITGIDWNDTALEPDFEAFNRAHSADRFDALTAALIG